MNLTVMKGIECPEWIPVMNKTYIKWSIEAVKYQNDKNGQKNRKLKLFLKMEISNQTKGQRLPGSTLTYLGSIFKK